jgi:hypothetical protein
MWLTSMKSGLWLLLLCSVLAMHAAACAFECGAQTCPTGCCAANACYEGTGVGGGAACASPGGRADAGNPGSTACKKQYEACAAATCCATNSSGDALACKNNSCERACGLSGDACNPASPCCKQSSSAYGLFCEREHCGLCLNREQECTPGSFTECCPGMSCLLRAGYTSVYECR